MYMEDYQVLSNYIVYIGRIVYTGHCSPVWLSRGINIFSFSRWVRGALIIIPIILFIPFWV